jgi:hypothetical protein
MDVRVSSVAVGHEFEEERTFLVVDGPLAGVLDCFLGSDDIHTVNLSKKKDSRVSDCPESAAVYMKNGKKRVGPIDTKDSLC